MVVDGPPSVLAHVLGDVIDVTQLPAEKVDISDIAQTLSHCNRFAGRTPYPYSVAQHAVLVSYLTSRKHAYEGLHHDDTEAFVGDVISTFKTDTQRELEQRVRLRLVPVLGLDPVEPPAVKDADLRALRLEQSLLQLRGDVKVSGMALGQLRHLRDVIELVRPMHHKRAAELYLARHWELLGVNTEVEEEQ